MIQITMRFILIILIIIFVSNVKAQKKGDATGLDLPRFVSTKSNDINLRVGPSINYPIILNYTKKNIPLEIIDEHEKWRQIKDYKNNIGWIHKNLLKGNRYAIISINKYKDYNLYNFPNGKKIGLIKNNNIVELKRCLDDWCLIKYNSYKGWIPKSEIWGVYSNENYNSSIFQPIIDFYWDLSKIKLR